MDDIHQNFARQGLIRPREGRVLGGVLAGLGQRFGLEPWTARLLFVLVLMVLPGSQILIYPVLWLLMPSEETVAYPGACILAVTGCLSRTPGERDPGQSQVRAGWLRRSRGRASSWGRRELTGGAPGSSSCT